MERSATHNAYLLPRALRLKAETLAAGTARTHLRRRLRGLERRGGTESRRPRS